MPEVVKFETMIPDGWERCEWGEQTAFAWGPPGNGPYYFTVDEGVLYITGQGYLPSDARFASLCGIIPIRKKVVKPLEIEFKPVHDCGHFIGCEIVDQYGNRRDIDTLQGKKFIEVVE